MTERFSGSRICLFRNQYRVHRDLRLRSEPFIALNVYDKQIERNISSGVLRLDGEESFNIDQLHGQTVLAYITLRYSNLRHGFTYKAVGSLLLNCIKFLISIRSDESLMYRGSRNWIN